MSWLGRLDLSLERCGSTNDEAARLAGLGAPHGTVVSAREQSEGRGRLGRAWSSPRGHLYLSILLRPRLPAAEVPPITLAAGVAVAETVIALGAPPELKWPNDVLCGGKKVAGVLTEMASQADAALHVVVGVGLDLAGEHPAELSAIATTVEREVGRAIDPAAARARLLAGLDRWLGAYLAGGVAAIAPAWLGHARLDGRRIRARGPDGPLEGRATGLAADGRLALIDDRGDPYYVSAGEVALVPP